MRTTVEQLLAGKNLEFDFVRPDAPVQHAITLMSELDVGSLLVCEGERLLGIVSARDCVRRVMAKGRSASATLVREVMTHGPICVSPDDTIEQCMMVMTEARIWRLPVVQQTRVLGVVTLCDAVRAVMREKDHLIEDLEEYITGSPSIHPPG